MLHSIYDYVHYEVGNYLAQHTAFRNDADNYAARVNHINSLDNDRLLDMISRAITEKQNAD